MRKESIGIMLLSASATCAVMLGLLVPLGVTAESEGGEIGEPAIEINGCRLSVRVVDYAVGKPVRLRVTSSTHTESVKSVPVHLEMEVEDLESRMSRVLTPREASVNWRYDGEIKCSEEKNTLELAADGKLGEGSMFKIKLSVRESPEVAAKGTAAALVPRGAEKMIMTSPVTVGFGEAYAAAAVQ